MSNKILQKLLFISPVNFDALKQRHQGLTLEFSKLFHEIYYINPICSGGLSIKSAKQDNIFIIDIKIPFKASAYPSLQKFSVFIINKLLEKKLKLTPSETILWIAEPALAELSNIKWKKIIYDCCDLHGYFPGQKAKVWKHYETILANNSNLITVSHQAIKNHFPEKYQKNCLLLPNATFFESQKTIKPQITYPIKILSSGAHYEWVDISWLKMIASLENIELHIAGNGRGKEFEELINIKNVIFHGAINSHQLQNLMMECHIGLVPFKNIELIKGVDPIKVYDYAAFNMEIWAPDIEALYSNVYITKYIKDKKTAQLSIDQMLYSNSYTPKTAPTWADRMLELEKNNIFK